jgi:hypothetical protein
MAIAHKWQPIGDLPDDPRSLTDGELDSLQRVWRNQKDQLDGAALDEFDKRLRREWAIETGIIEDVYTLDRGVTQTLIEKGIDAALIPRDATNRDTTLVARLIQDHYEALEGMFDFVAGRREISTSYVKELHAALLRNADTHTVVDQLGRVYEKPLEKGQYKALPNNPTRPDGSLHEYCPPEHVASEMDALIRKHLDHELRGIPLEVEAAWLHHRFTQIHPFADGNGRVARAIASLVFIKAGLFPLIVKRDDRLRYIEALETADEGDLRPLVSLFVEAQRNVLIEATEIAYEVRPITSAHEAVLAVRDRLLQKGKPPLKEWFAVKEVATQLSNQAVKQLGDVAIELSREIASFGTDFTFTVNSGSLGPPIQDRAVQIAGHEPNYGEYSSVVHLNLQSSTAVALVLSFHAMGPRFRGLIGIVAYLATPNGGAALIEGGTFQINYEEDLESAKKRFSAWLNQVIINGLNVWRRTL